MKKFIYNLVSALRAISAHKFQSAVTCIGIIFGTSALITFFAIFKGYTSYLEQQNNISGKGNIIIVSVNTPAFSQKYIADSIRHAPAGLTTDDALSIKKLLPDASYVCYNNSVSANTSFKLTNKQTKLAGICCHYLKIFPYKIIEGKKLLPLHFSHAMPVCIISSDIKKNLFPASAAIGKWIKCDNTYLKVTGVYEVRKDVMIPEELKSVNYYNSVLAPYNTVLLRFSKSPVATPLTAGMETSASLSSLEKIVVNFENHKNISQSADVINRLLLRRHNNIRDFRIIIPEHILKKETIKPRTSMFIILSVSIISFLIGGISIMNYIYSYIYEKMEEIKLLYDNGVSNFSIGYRFILQATILSFSAGLLGIIAGIISSKIFFSLTKISTIIPLSSIFISFAITILTGIVFSYLPVRRLSSINNSKG